MKSVAKLSFALPLIALIGCSNPADKVAPASVSSATNATAETASSAPAEQPFSFGPANSKIEFVGSKVTGSHRGGFRNFVGEFKVANGKIADAGNKIVIDAASIWADNDRLTGHLKTPDFFNAAQFPTATFLSTGIEDHGTNSTVKGNLTMHGVTKQISFPAKLEVSDSVVKVNAQFFINRFDFNIKYPGKANDLIRKEVVLKLDVNAAPGKADFSSLEKTTPAAAAPPSVALASTR